MNKLRLICDNELQRLVDDEGNVTNRIVLNDNSQTKIIKISPWHPEHYSSIILYKVKIWAEKNNVKVIAEANANYLPAISQIADEIYLQEFKENRYYVDADCKSCGSFVKLKSLFYCKHCNNVFDYPECPVHNKKCRDFLVGFCTKCCMFVDRNSFSLGATSNCVRKCVFFKDAPGRFEDVRVDYTNPALLGEDKIHRRGKSNFLNVVASQVSDQEVIERFANPEVCILESAYQKFLGLKDQLKSNVIMLHTKSVRYSMSDLLKDDIILPVVDMDYQREVMNLAGSDYMTFQLLGSIFLNWFFICQRGASNILCMLPINNLILWDVVSYPYSNILRGLSVSRFGEISRNVPVLDDCYVLDGKRVELYKYIIWHKESINSFIRHVVNLKNENSNQSLCTIQRGPNQTI